MTTETKKCTKCGEVKAMSQFHKDRYRFDGVNSICKECIKEKTSSYYKKNKEKQKERVLKWRLENKEAYSESQRKWKEKNIGKENERKRNAGFDLKDSYIVGTLRIPAKDCTPELIELKREQLRIQRLTKQLKKEIQNG